MRIVIFHTALPRPGVKPGGVEIAVHRLAEALAAAPEDTVTVLSVTGAPPGARYAHKRLFPHAPWLHQHKVARWALLPLLLNVVRWPAADVVHLHGDDWFLIRRPWPTVRSFHGSALREGQSATSWRRRAMITLHPLERLARRLATLSCATDDDTKRLLRTDAIQPPDGVDLDTFHPGPKETLPTVLFVGTWGGRKRGALVHEAFMADVRPFHPDAQLWMVTDVAPPANFSVRHFPAPDDEELASLYRRAWVFAYPSSYEGFGLPYLEAMASGTAVVATRCAAADRLLGNGGGRVVADADFGIELRQVLDDAVARRSLESRGRELAAQSNWSIIADDHRALYREAIRRDAPRNGIGVNRPVRASGPSLKQRRRPGIVSSPASRGCSIRWPRPRSLLYRRARHRC